MSADDADARGDDDDQRRARAARRPGLPRRRRPAQRRREPRPPPARARLRARLRVRRDRRQARSACRSRSATTTSPRPAPGARVGARDVQLLGRRRAHRRRLPRRRADRPLRQHQHDRRSATTTSPRCACPAPAARPRSPRSARSVIVLLRHSPRAFVDELDFVTSVGRGSTAPQRRRAAGRRVITDLGVLRPRPRTASSSSSRCTRASSSTRSARRPAGTLRVRDPLEVTEPVTERELVRAARAAGLGRRRLTPARPLA